MDNIAPYTYAGIIPLSSIQNGDVITLRFYITWTNNNNNNEVDSLYGSSSEDFEIPISITFRQYTGETIEPINTPIATATTTPAATSTPNATEDPNNNG